MERPETYDSQEMATEMQRNLLREFARIQINATRVLGGFAEVEGNGGNFKIALLQCERLTDNLAEAPILPAMRERLVQSTEKMAKFISEIHELILADIYALKDVGNTMLTFHRIDYLCHDVAQRRENHPLVASCSDAAGAEGLELVKQADQLKSIFDGLTSSYQIALDQAIANFDGFAASHQEHRATLSTHMDAFTSAFETELGSAEGLDENYRAYLRGIAGDITGYIGGYFEVAQHPVENFSTYAAEIRGSFERLRDSMKLSLDTLRRTVL
ncbi:MAG TPA: hypothetical protein VI588_03485 [Candidatus Gracilibacteria bacterium]|nr:hypothetical protein [Candidatus Gracilibacteria bacterium]